MKTTNSRNRPARRWLRRVELIVTLGLFCFVAWRLGPQLSAWTGVGPSYGPAPQFELTALDGTSFSGEQLRGEVVVVNFWATWCGPCRVEMPALQKLHERFADDGLVVLGLSVDSEDRTVVERYLIEREYEFPVVMVDAATRLAFGDFNAIPTTFIIDREGTIRHRITGIFAPPAMTSAVKRLLRERSVRRR